ncbi:hypothetical protein [Kineococcus arenarius]|uniref:hypothetical protein n=1 Tax=Kineococcus sp. SYSU DK007 TaxID=3383128 RepID=UPI003D7E2F42
MVPADVPSAAAEHGSGSPPALLEAVLRPGGLQLRLDGPSAEDLLVALSRGDEDAVWEDVDVLPAGSSGEVLDVGASTGDRVLLRSEDGTRASRAVPVVNPDAAPQQPEADGAQPGAGAPAEDAPGDGGAEDSDPGASDPQDDDSEDREALWQVASTLEERHGEWNAHPEGPVLHVHGRFGNTFRVAAEGISAGAGDVRAVCAISARGDYTLLVAQGRELLRAEERAGVPTQWRHYDLPAHLDAAALAQNPDVERRCRRPQRSPLLPPEGALTLLRDAGIDVSAPLDRCTA